jgi:hypothetical protein
MVPRGSLFLAHRLRLGIRCRPRPPPRLAARPLLRLPVWRMTSSVGVKVQGPGSRVQGPGSRVQGATWV